LFLTSTVAADICPFAAEAVEVATLGWVDWFNNRRLLEPIRNIPPAQAEANYEAAQKPIAWAA